MPQVSAGDYTLRLEGTGIVATNAKGKDLKSVPAKVKKTPEFEQLNALATSVKQHAQQCADCVSSWFLRGEPVPTAALQAVWKDPYWRGSLDNLVISDGATKGLLKSADAEGVHVVDLDGETLVLTAEEVTIPHPALIEDVEDWREFISELGAVQGLDQIFRDVYPKPADAASQREALKRFAGAKFEKASYLMSRGRSGGFNTGLFDASVTVREGERSIIAMLHFNAYDPADEALLEMLSFFDAETDAVIPPNEVGPITWSEGMRMGEYFYAARMVDEEKK